MNTRVVGPSLQPLEDFSPAGELAFWRRQYRRAYFNYRRSQAALAHEARTTRSSFLMAFFNDDVSQALQNLRTIKPLFQEAINNYYGRS